MINRIVLFVGVTAFAATAHGQTVLQGDSLYRGLQVGKSTLEDIRRIMGSSYRKGKMIRQFHAKWRDGGTGSYQVIYGYILEYQRDGVQFAIETAEKPEGQQTISGIQFRPKSSITTFKGISPANTFADVISRYGPLDTTQTRRVIPYVYGWSVDRGEKTEKRYTILRYGNGIRFVSYGPRNEAENLNVRRVDEIWLD
ncbi:hypothetical protein KBK19_14460 [Microvirga sp. STR05]|uniref:Lipoprotein SmpA/OmlA domain-containing protein n=1 Tax=Hymenobacter duratus TaxID=2771356 RepID=A0ABR8JHC3_9BACT|nr:hypothetical protein [Hymenobacter duratus]MBD2716241.1 hypothetical protein [Hymenobacter duratus]MBR7951155.1 hypothetical protein [Microvirga sp. STR05]